jgi:Uma2 family endonuclease
MNLGYTRSMRAVMLDVPEHILEERRRNGWDHRDEVWEGVLHMVPPASTRHNFTATDLVVFLRRVGERRGLLVTHETGVFDPAIPEYWSYRVPDLVMASRDVFSERGAEGKATLVVEVLSPNDESRDKLPFYARVGVKEVWLVHPVTRAFELFELRGHELVPRDPDAGVTRSPVLGIEIVVDAGPLLRLRDGDDAIEI